ncbi:DUF3800 domain-containing protein [Fibrella aquatica]|uniref:DUF3800 domain-containing protein n=1 Tax=Fibrella aquatica TaxID=3242487 RepID=UPI0035229A02
MEIQEKTSTPEHSENTPVTDKSIFEEISTEKSKQRKSEREKLLNQIASGQIHSSKEKVAYILNLFNEARNSDIDLAWEYWRIFEPKLFNGGHIDREGLRSLTKITSLARMRAKIQNEYDLYLANEDVRKFRGVLKEDIKQASVADKPSKLKPYYVYIDEAGKTQRYLSVGSIWLLDIGAYNLASIAELGKWKEERSVNYEFHFSSFNDKKRIEVYKEFCLKFFSLFPTLGYKVIVIDKSGFSDINSVLTDLTYHLLARGVHHEHESGRAPLPRKLQVYLDNESEGSDNLKLENIRERLTGQNIAGLYLDSFEAVSSENNFFIQMTDLVTGSVNRKINTPDGNNHKDELANFLLDILDLDVSKINTQNDNADNAEVFNLTSKAQ